ncbi:uncharacterized protein LOC129569184 [Sitodiplosis mosellana]|uniref:uncharacterized protein LOC129569184 n=1 Tax=Sitodiplosis mosellana TaxID=263140 RepID=UPI002444D596|nr:uncharacterized protein LOC129569184 [Sitodiplosis mosellana]
MGKLGNIKNTPVEDDDEGVDLRNGAPSDNFGASFIFERALKRMDVQTQQRRLQQEKFDSQLKNVENDYKILELRLTNKDKDLQKLNDKLKSTQTQLVAIKIEKDILEMKLEAEFKNTHRLNRDVEHLDWARNELLAMIHRSRNIEELRQKLLSRKLY